MPRQGRINIEGGIYHVIQRGLERRELFKDNADREEFVRRLAEGLKATEAKCLGWALMPNHFHLLIRTGVRPLSDLMRRLLTGYAIYFNRKYKRSGYLYQNRYKSILCQEDAYLLELVRYIHLNPLRAKIVKDMHQLNKYKWSGHSVIVGENTAQWQSIGEILEYFSNRKSEAIKKYVNFVEEGKVKGKREEFTGGGLRRSAGGKWSEVLALKRAKEYRQADERVLGDGGFVEEVLKAAEEKVHRNEMLVKNGWDLSKVDKRVCEIYNLEKGGLKNRSRLNAVSKARKVFMYLASKELGKSGTDIAKYLRITAVAVSKGIRHGETLSRESGWTVPFKLDA